MLFLLFHLDGDDYALAAARVLRVLPLLSIKRIPHAPAPIAGAIDYRGALVPVIDLSMLLLGRGARSLLSTRIVLVHDGSRDMGPWLGLVTERATQSFHCAESASRQAALKNPDAPYLGPMLTGPRGLVQRVEVDALLSPSLRALLSAGAVGS